MLFSIQSVKLSTPAKDTQSMYGIINKPASLSNLKNLKVVSNMIMSSNISSKNASPISRHLKNIIVQKKFKNNWMMYKVKAFLTLIFPLPLSQIL